MWGSVFAEKRRKWPTRTNSSILSWSALHSSVVWPLFLWYRQYLVMSALGWLDVLRSGGMRSSRSRDLGTLSGAYLVKRGCLGSLGLESGRGGGLSRSMVEGV